MRDALVTTGPASDAADCNVSSAPEVNVSDAEMPTEAEWAAKRMPTYRSRSVNSKQQLPPEKRSVSENYNEPQRAKNDGIN